MSIITDQKIVINKNFEQAINEVKSPTGDKASIPYRDWMEERKQVEVFKVPIEYCRYRLENGRISIETSSYSVTTKPLDQDLGSGARLSANDTNLKFDSNVNWGFLYPKKQTSICFPQYLLNRY